MNGVLVFLVVASLCVVVLAGILMVWLWLEDEAARRRNLQRLLVVRTARARMDATTRSIMQQMLAESQRGGQGHS